MAGKKFFFLFLCCLVSLSLSAQNNRITDSLEHGITIAKPEQKTQLLIRLSDEFVNSDLKKAQMYAEKALNLATTSKDSRGKLSASLTLSKIYYFRSDLTRAMEFAVKSKTMAEELSLDDYLARSLDGIGAIYYDIGNQSKSSENFYASLKIYERLQDKNGIGGTFCRIGTLYLDQKDYDKALEYYSKSLTIAKEINSKEGVSSNLNNLAKVYFKKREYEKALNSYTEALQINLQNDNNYLAANNYLNIADVYIALREYPIAISDLQKARTIFEKLGNKLRLAKSQILLSEIYLETGQRESCETVAANALKIGEDQGYKEIIVGASTALYKLYLAKNDSTAAFKYFILEKQYNDSLFLDEKQRTLAKLELQYQFDKNEEAQKVARQRKNILILIISGCLFFSLDIFILIIKQLRLKAKKLQLEKAGFEKELEFKNKEMVLKVMSLMKKNEMLADLSEKLNRIDEEATSEESKETIRKVAGELQKSQEEEIWKEFSIRFKEVHGEFYDKLLQRFPALSPNDLKLCAFLRMNMSTKDIAQLTGQRVSSLETARYRLRQKLGIVNSDANLITFLSSL